MSDTLLDSNRVKITTIVDTANPNSLGSTATMEEMVNYIISQMRRVVDPAVAWNTAPATNLVKIASREPIDVHKVFTYSGGNLSGVSVYTDNTETTLIYSKTFTYTSGVLTGETYTRGAVTKNRTFVYSGADLTAINLT